MVEVDLVVGSFLDIVGVYYWKYYVIYSFWVLNDYLFDKILLKLVELIGKQFVNNGLLLYYYGWFLIKQI